MPSLPRVHMGCVLWTGEVTTDRVEVVWPVPLTTTWARATGAAVPAARGGMLVLLAATRDKVSAGAPEPDAVGAPEEPAPNAVALPRPEWGSMAGVCCVGAEAGEVGAGPWAPGAGAGEGTLDAGTLALGAPGAGAPEAAAKEHATATLGPTGIVETSASSKNSKW
jgi:hypothetical protein